MIYDERLVAHEETGQQFRIKERTMPACLILNEQQKTNMALFYEFIKKTVVEKTLNRHDSCGTSPFEFRVRGSGLGDSVSVHAYGYKCYLDDEDIVTEKDFKKEEESWFTEAKSINSLPITPTQNDK